MNAEQLVAKIEASPALAVHFQRSDTGNGICPCCVERVLKIQDQDEVEFILDAIVECAESNEKIKAEIDTATRELRTRLDNNMKTWRQLEHRLYELRNAQHQQ